MDKELSEDITYIYVLNITHNKTKYSSAYPDINIARAHMYIDMLMHLNQNDFSDIQFHINYNIYQTDTSSWEIIPTKFYKS